MRQAARLAAWGVAACGAIALAPSTRFGHGRTVTVARSLMPWAGLAAAPLAVIAHLGGRRNTAASGMAVATASAAMCRTLIRPDARAAPPVAPSPTLAVAHANLLSVNRRVAEVGERLAVLAADVVTFSEYTPSHATNLKSTALARRFPHRVELAAPRSSGTALWSRYPVTMRPTAATTHETVIADVHAPHGDVRVVVVHTQSPVAHHGEWLADLERLTQLVPTPPTIMTGDFNAGWWHPEFRALLGTTWRDAHLAVGRGLSSSWPTARWNILFHWLPPFVRLDHALLTPDLAVVDVIDLPIPGSDHLGLLVTVTGAPLSGE